MLKAAHMSPKPYSLRFGGLGFRVKGLGLLIRVEDKLNFKPYRNPTTPNA